MKKHVLAGLAGVGAIGALALAPAAMAAPGPGNIDPNAEGSLTIHKFETPDPWAEDTNNLGTEITVPGSWEAIEGVTFKVERVTALEDGTAVNLTTPAGWDAIDGLTPAAAATGTLATATGSPQTTNAAGVASFTDLPVGLYLVTETSKPAHVTSTVAPFLVTIPTPVISGDSAYWNYDVHAYPKNSVINVNKTVEALNQKALGEQIVWTVEGSVPLLGTDENHTKYEMVDTLPTQVTYDSSAVEFDGATIDAANYTVSAAGSNPVTMTLTPAGLAALKSGGVEKVSWKLTTTVNALATDGELINNVTLQANDSDKIPGEAQQDWGGIEITKVAKGGPGADKTLQGAEFQLFKTQADATAKTNPITVSGVETFVTGENGKVTIDGVQVGTYWLAETKAPAGYILDATPIQVAVTAGDMTSLVPVSVENAQHSTTELPKMGATGIAALAIIGTALVGAGVLASRRARA